MALFLFDMSICNHSIETLQLMVAAGTSDSFYDWAEWLRMRDKVLAMDRNECQHCKAKHRYKKAIIVHHVKYLKDRPDLALSIFDPDTGERQLVSLCRACHEAQHSDRRCKPCNRAKRFVTRERWD